MEQVVRSDAEKARIRQQKTTKAAQKRTGSKKKGKPGRPQGSPNKNKRQIDWTEELHRVKRMASTLVARVHPLGLRYLVLDGHFGTNNVMQMVRQGLALHLIDYYQLRFQIEFNFRDAKQLWGFEDFMNVQSTPVTNAVGLSFFMVNGSHLLLTQFRQAIPEASLLDLKAHFRARRYAREALKLLPDGADPILMDQILETMPALGAIRPQQAPLPTL